MGDPRFYGSGAVIHPNVLFGSNVEIGHGSIVGYGIPSDIPTVVGDNVSIGAFCTIYFGAALRGDVLIDDYCKVCTGVVIGAHTRVLYGKHVYDHAVVGEHCIIGGHVADRTVIEDRVTFLGDIAHSHRDASLSWDDTEEESPAILRGSVVGLNALIVGPRRIGPCAYIAAGEVVRSDVGEGMLLSNGEQIPLATCRRMIRSRC